MNLTKEVYNSTESFIAEMPKKQRKEYGQFFTVPSTADYMASLAQRQGEAIQIRKYCSVSFIETNK